MCVNKLGSYECDCRRGYTKQSGGLCSAVTTTTESPKEALSVDLNVKIEYDLPNGTNLNSSTTYEEVKSKVKASLVEFYKRYSNATVDIIIKDIRTGSIDVDYKVVSVEQLKSLLTELARATLALGRGTLLIIDGQNFSATAEKYKNASPCEVFESIKRCDDKYRCVVEGDTPMCRLEQENWPAIIGGTAGGVLLIIVAAMAVVWCVRFKRGKKKMKRYAPTEGDGSHTKREYTSNFRNMHAGEGNSEAGNLGNLTWRSMMTKMTLPSYRNQDPSSPYRIPRVTADNLYRKN